MDKSTCELDDERKERSGYPAAWKYQKKSSGPSSARKKKEHSRFGERNYTPPGWKVLQMGSWDMETI